MSQDAARWTVVHHKLTEVLRGLARDHASLQKALVGCTIEQAVNNQLGQVCLSEGYAASEYVSQIQSNPNATRELDRLIGALLQHPVVVESKRTTVLNEVREQLAVFDAVLAGQAEGDPNELAQLQGLLGEMARVDPSMPDRVHRAAQKEPSLFGACEVCRSSIAAGRLQLLPYAERCTNCQIEFEGPARQPPPPVIPFSSFSRRASAP